MDNESDFHFGVSNQNHNLRLTTNNSLTQNYIYVSNFNYGKWKNPHA